MTTKALQTMIKEAGRHRQAMQIVRSQIDRTGRRQVGAFWHEVCQLCSRLGPPASSKTWATEVALQDGWSRNYHFGGYLHRCPECREASRNG